jgi:colanic acid/amylovoran biosynthesis glycosyltransferase
MKVAFVVSVFPALSETFILNQLTGLIDRGHEVDVFSEHQGASAEQHPAIDAYELQRRTFYAPRMPESWTLRAVKGLWLLLRHGWKAPLVCLRSLNVLRYGRPSASLWLLFQTIPFLRRGSYDVVHCHFGPNGTKGMMLRECGAVRGPLVTAFYGYDVSQHVRKYGPGVYRSLFRAGDRFLAITKKMSHQLVQFGCDEAKVTVHPIGVDCTVFPYSPRSAPGTSRPVRILTIARLVEKKGIEYGIRAVATLIHGTRKFEYRIAGDGPLRPDLQQMINTMGLQDSVTLLGGKPQPEIIALFRASDILLAPSVTAGDGDQEGSPVVLMEAMASGVPVVTTEHAGIPEVVENGVSGFLAPERDVRALVRHIDYLLANPDSWAAVSRAARAHIEEHYDVQRLNDRLVTIYHDILRDDPGRSQAVGPRRSP